jgi:hypothetical protein
MTESQQLNCRQPPPALRGLPRCLCCCIKGRSRASEAMARDTIKRRAHSVPSLLSGRANPMPCPLSLTESCMKHPVRRSIVKMSYCCAAINLSRKAWAPLISVSSRPQNLGVAMGLTDKRKLTRNQTSYIQPNHSQELSTLLIEVSFRGPRLLLALRVISKPKTLATNYRIRA